MSGFGRPPVAGKSSGARHGKAPRPRNGGTINSVPAGVALRFMRRSGKIVLHEYRNGRRMRNITWGKKEFYARGDSFGISTFATKDLRKLDSIFPGVVMPGGGATMGNLLMAMLGEKGEEFVFGWEIVQIDARPGDGFAGSVRVRPYFVPKDDVKSRKSRTYGREEVWRADPRGGYAEDSLHSRFATERHIYHASGAVEAVMEVSIILVENLTGGPVKKAGKKAAKEAAKLAGKTLVADPKSRVIARKSISHVAKSVLAMAQALDDLAIAAMVAFVKGFAADLLSQSKRRTQVLSAVVSEIKLPVTTVILITKKGEETISVNWNRAAWAGATSAAAKATEKFLEGKFEKWTKKDIEIDMQILKSHASGGEHTIRKELREEFGKAFYKVLFTDQVTRVIKAVGSAANDAQNADDFPLKLREAFAKEFNPIEVAKSAIADGLAAFSATAPG